MPVVVLENNDLMACALLHPSLYIELRLNNDNMIHRYGKEETEPIFR